MRQLAAFQAENAPPVAPAAPSKTFVTFPCGQPPLDPKEQEIIWANEALYDRYQRMHNRLELDLRARSLQLAHQVDSISLLRLAADEQRPPPGQRRRAFLDPLATRGVPCAQATDEATCRSAVKRLHEQVVTSHPCDENACPPVFEVYAQTTVGDQVQLHRGPQELLQLFGAIDTPMEAWFMLVSREIFPGFGCGDPEIASYKDVTNGYSLRGRRVTSSCQPLRIEEQTWRVTTDGAIRMETTRAVRNQHDGCVVSGRRPAGYREAGPAHRDLRGYLARAAALEAASIVAFDVLERELAQLGAPSALLSRVRRAREDEIVHAKRMTKAAERFDAKVDTDSMPGQQALRGRFELALDNAREGCVRELFGALVATFQATRAQDSGLVAIMREIASDEQSHAALSWHLAAWLEADLNTHEREAVRQARIEALRELREELCEPDPHAAVIAGLPSLAEARILADAVAFWVEEQAA